MKERASEIIKFLGLVVGAGLEAWGLGFRV